MTTTPEERLMLTRLIRAMMTYYGPIAMINATIEESDKVIEEMAVSGFMKEAKQFAHVLGDVRASMIGDDEKIIALHGPRCGCHYCT